MRIKSLAAFMILILVAGSLPGSGNCHASLILGFRQTSDSNTVNGTKSGDTFTVDGTGVEIQITQAFPGASLSLPITAYLTFHLVNNGAAAPISVTIPPAVTPTVIGGSQAFTGSFSITENANGTGTSYLSSANFSSFILGVNDTTATSVVSTGDVGFASDVLGGVLATPNGISFSLGNLSPGFGLNGSTLRDFSASVSGSANATIPEPSSMVTAVIGVCMFTTLVGRRHRKEA